MNKSIQVFRAVAFVFVFLIHAWGFFIYTFESVPYPRWLVVGTQMSVSFFVILAGFLFGCGRREEKCNLHAMCTLTKNRLRKLYPIHFLCFMLMCIIPIRQYVVEGNGFNKALFFKNAFLNAFLLQSWFPSGYYDFNGVAWFLSTIIFLTAISIPLYTILKKREKCLRNLTLMALLWGGSALNIIYSMFIHHIFHGQYDEYLIYIFPMARVIEYVCGMATGISTQNETSSFGTARETEAVTLFVITFVLSVISGIPDYLTRSSVWIIPSCYLLHCFWINKGLITDLLTGSRLYFLGDISFKAFMIHYPVLYTVSMLIPTHKGSRPLNVALIGYCFLITCVLSKLCTPYSRDN